MGREMLALMIIELICDVVLIGLLIPIVYIIYKEEKKQSLNKGREK
jgi:cbb3-type cytochrome oxidase subunit 3